VSARARELGLERTRFANAIGLDDPDNYSTARDLASLSARLMRNRSFERIVDLPEAVLDSGSRRRVVDNRNLLIARYPFVDGVKTGHTRSAGYVLVGSGSGRGVRVITVVLGEPSESARDSDTVALLRWGIDQFRRERVLTRGATVAKVGVKWRGDETARLTTPATVALTVRRGERVMRQLDAPGELEGPLASATYQDTVWALPHTSNTQLLWYRKSVAEQAGIDPTSGPVTWDQVIKAAEQTNTTVEVTGARYEGYMVLINALVLSAGGEVLKDPEAGKDAIPELDTDPGRKAAEIIHRVLAGSSAAE